VPKLALLGHHGRRILGDDHSDSALKAAGSAGSGFFVDVFCDNNFNVCVGHGRQKTTTLGYVADLAQELDAELAIYPDYKIGDDKVFVCLEVILQVLRGREVKAMIYSADPAVHRRLDGRIETGYLAGDIQDPDMVDQVEIALDLKVKHLAVYSDFKHVPWITELAKRAREKRIQLLVNVKDETKRGIFLLLCVPGIGIIADDPESIAKRAIGKIPK
jgi:hypothetical protein